MTDKKAEAFGRQEDGSHYMKLAIQPMQYSMANGLDALQHSVVKYVTRFRDKNGVVDLRKAIHCLEMLIEHEEGREPEPELPLSAETHVALSKQEIAAICQRIKDRQACHG
jgi:hypothetical protein